MFSLAPACLHPPSPHEGTSPPSPFMRHPTHTFSLVSRCLLSVSRLTYYCPKAPDAIRSSISHVNNFRTVDYEKKPPSKWYELFQRVSQLRNPNLSAVPLVDGWEKERGQLKKWELFRVTKELGKFRRFKHALDILEWVASQGERFNFYASDAAILLNHICRVRGISFAEDYFSSLSEELKEKRTYASLLNGYANAMMKEKAEAVFETIRNKGYVENFFAFNAMVRLYWNMGEYAKVISLINEMKEKNVQMNTFSYNFWVKTCAALGDVGEMERVLDLAKKDPGLKTTWSIYYTFATTLIQLGEVDKAEKYIKDAEDRITGRHRQQFERLILLYSLIGEKEEVYRVWERYNSSFREMLNSGYSVVLSALVRINDIDGAEKLYNVWLTSTYKYDPKICNILVSYYAHQGLVEEAKNHLECFVDKGGAPNSKTWELLAEGHIVEKRIPKALSCFQEAASIASRMEPLGGKWRPKPTTVANFLLLCKELNDQSSLESLVEVLKKVKCLQHPDYKFLITDLQEKVQT